MLSDERRARMSAKLGRARTLVFSCCFCLPALVGTARAASGETAGSQTRASEARPAIAALSVEVPSTIAITAAAAVVWMGSEAAKEPYLGARACRWCDPGPIDRAIRNRVVWRHPTDAIKPSDVVAHVVAPIATVALTGLAAGYEDMHVRELALDLLVVAEATALAADLSQLLKFSVGRQRPFARAGLPDPDTSQLGEHDENASFYSGHTNLVFVLAASAGTVATLRHYRLAPIIWITGAVLGAATAYLRMAADQHYFTDVLAGAVVGTGVGVSVPWYFHRPRDGASPTALTLSPLPRGAALTYLW
jgi:membrane-associated phospholipid phosphatase